MKNILPWCDFFFYSLYSRPSILSEFAFWYQQLQVYLGKQMFEQMEYESAPCNLQQA